MVTRTPLGLRVSQLSARHASHSLALTVRVGRRAVGEYPPSPRRRPETRLGLRGGGDRAVQPARGPWLGPRPPGPGITPLPARPQVSSFVNSAQDTCPVRLGVGVRIKWGDACESPAQAVGVRQREPQAVWLWQWLAIEPPAPGPTPRPASGSASPELRAPWHVLIQVTASPAHGAGSHEWFICPGDQDLP